MPLNYLFYRGARRRRDISKVTFKPEDVIVMGPKQIDENLAVELAVVKIMPDGSSFLVYSENLTQILHESAPEIGQLLGGTLISVKPKFPGPTTPSPQVVKTSVPGPSSTKSFDGKTTTATQTQTSSVVNTAVPGPITQAPVAPGQAAASKAGNNGGVIGGVVVAVLVIVILVIALAVWYFR